MMWNGQMINILNRDTSQSLKQCGKHWDFSWIIPLPKNEPVCPNCNSQKSVIRQASLHTRTDSKSKYRCRICFKCTECSFVYTFGIVIPKKMYDENPERIFSFNELRSLWRNKNE